MSDDDRPTSSSVYWRTSEAVRDELSTLAQMGNDMQCDLEQNDDPGEVADNLAAILERLDALRDGISVNLKPLRAVSKALADVPGVDLS
jgi:hypothetical protein